MLNLCLRFYESQPICTYKKRVTFTSRLIGQSSGKMNASFQLRYYEQKLSHPIGTMEYVIQGGVSVVVNILMLENNCVE